jgi:hypothetical protein
VKVVARQEKHTTGGDFEVKPPGYSAASDRPATSQERIQPFGDVDEEVPPEDDFRERLHTEKEQQPQECRRQD